MMNPASTPKTLKKEKENNSNNDNESTSNLPPIPDQNEEKGRDEMELVFNAISDIQSTINNDGYEDSTNC